MSREEEITSLKRELDIARQTHFNREKSLESRLQLMGEKLKEWQDIVQSHEDMLLPALKQERLELQSHIRELEEALKNISWLCMATPKKYEKALAEIQSIQLQAISKSRPTNQKE